MVELKERIRGALAAERITEKEADIAAWTAGEKTIVIYSAKQMAALIWRFKKTGTISA